MPIDWFTVGAQALNFLLLAWLLKRFLYQPVLDAIDARERRIAAELADADAKRAEAMAERDAYRAKNAAFEQERATLLARAAADADAERSRLLAEARVQADALAERRRSGLRNEARELDRTVARQVREEAFAIAGRALSELAESSLEAQMCAVLLRRLDAMDPAARAQFSSALASGREPVLVRSAVALAPPQREAIEAAIARLATPAPRIAFEASPGLLSGIEVSANGIKLAWSLSDYLAALHRDLESLVEADEADRVPSREPAGKA